MWGLFAIHSWLDLESAAAFLYYIFGPDGTKIPCPHRHPGLDSLVDDEGLSQILTIGVCTFFSHSWIKIVDGQKMI